MKTEISAGGVIYRKKGKSWQILLLKDKNDHWTFPKGLIEDGEEKVKAAQREIGEEVGLKEIKLVTDLTPIKYWYMQSIFSPARNKRQNDLIHKTVYYFLFETEGSEETRPQKEEGITDVRWFSPTEALKEVGYRKTNEPILQEVIKKCESQL